MFGGDRKLFRYQGILYEVELARAGVLLFIRKVACIEKHALYSLAGVGVSTPALMYCNESRQN